MLPVSQLRRKQIPLDGSCRVFDESPRKEIRHYVGISYALASDARGAKHAFGPSFAKGCGGRILRSSSMRDQALHFLLMAEREGFEPSVPLRVHMISNHAH